MRALKELASSFSVLYVEDDQSIREDLARYLSKYFGEVMTAADGIEGLKQYHEHRCDIVITDIMMPKMNGIELAKEIRGIDPDQIILITTAYTEQEYLLETIRMNINGYLLKPISIDQMNETLYQAAKKLQLIKENELRWEDLESLVEEKTEKEHQMELDKTDNYEKTLVSLVKLIDERDSYTGGHSQRVAEYAKMIAKEMGYSDYECDLVYRAGILHDIGKIATPDAVLLKPGRLTELEFQLIKEHVTVGAQLLIKIPMYRVFYHIIISHHERYDGSGYPSGLEGDEIPPLARVMMVADSFDAMTTNRIYKGRKSAQEALAEFEELAGIHYHQDVVEAAVIALKDVTIEHTSQLPSSAVEKERFAYYYKDQVANVYNRNYLEVVLTKNEYDKRYLCMNLFLLHDFTRYNGQFGWQRGDLLLNAFAEHLKGLFPEGLLFRIHGDDFIVLNEEHQEIDLSELQRLDLLVQGGVTVESEHFHIVDDVMSTLDRIEAHIST